jgi:hypothetical protein
MKITNDGGNAAGLVICQASRGGRLRQPAVLLNVNGNLAEGMGCNVFVIGNGTLYTRIAVDEVDSNNAWCHRRLWLADRYRYHALTYARNRA